MGIRTRRDVEETAQDFVEKLPETPPPEIEPGARFIEGILDNCDAIAVRVVEVLFEGLNGLITDALAPLLTLAIICFGIMVLMGWTEYPIKEFAKKVFFWVLVLGVLFNADVFFTVFYDPLMKGPPAIVAFLAKKSGLIAPGIPPNAFLDEIADKCIGVMNAIADGSGWVYKWIMWVVMFIFGFIAIVSAAVIMALAKMALTLLLSVAPLFLFAFMFQLTKPMFQNWLQQAFNYSLLLIFVNLIAGFYLILVSNVMPDPTSGDLEFADIQGFVLVSIMLIILLFQISAIASSLAGGLQLGVASIAEKVKGAAVAPGALAMLGAKMGAKKLKGIRNAGKMTGV